MTSTPGVRRFTVTETREVMEVTADNLDEVAAWCGGVVERVPMPDGTDCEYVAFEGPHGLDHVYPDAMLIRDSRGFTYTSRARFERAGVDRGDDMSDPWRDEVEDEMPDGQVFDVMAYCPYRHPELGWGCSETWGHDGDHRSTWRDGKRRPAIVWSRDEETP